MADLLAKPTTAALIAPTYEYGIERTLPLTDIKMWGEWMWGAIETYGAAQTVRSLVLRTSPTRTLLLATLLEE